MELVIVFIIGVAVGDMDHKQQLEIDTLKEQVVGLKDSFLRLAGSHSALSAREKVNDDLQKRRIEGIMDELRNAPVAE